MKKLILGNLGFAVLIISLTVIAFSLIRNLIAVSPNMAWIILGSAIIGLGLALALMRD